MIKYFKNCTNGKSLKREYIRLMKQYHPDLNPDEKDKELRNSICKEINAEYEALSKQLPKESQTKSIKYDFIINGNDLIKKVCNEIEKEFDIPNIEYKFYYYSEGVNWSEEELLQEIMATINLFWEVCKIKKIVGDEFLKLYELCNFNAEKMKRVIMFLSTGAIADSIIHTNLQSDNAIPFFNDEISVENLPDYNSFFLLSKLNTKSETISAWIEFCQNQRDDFLNRFYSVVVPKITGEKKI